MAGRRGLPCRLRRPHHPHVPAVLQHRLAGGSAGLPAGRQGGLAEQALDEIDGEASRAWVSERNEATERAFGDDPAFLRLVDDYRAGYVMREASVVDTEEFCAALRALALEAGRRMSQAGLIPAPGDVKFLTADELLAWLRGSAVDVAGIVARRRRARPLAEAAWHEGRKSGDGDGVYRDTDFRRN